MRNWTQSQKIISLSIFESIHNVTWVYILAGIFFLIGLVMGTTGLKSMRSKEHPQAEISWRQSPLSPWRYETLTIIAIAIHSLGLICLAAFLLLSLARNQLLAFPPIVIPSLLVSGVAVFGVLFTTYASGVMVAYHFMQRWITPISYGISSDGMLYGGSAIHWQSYSHYEVGPEHGMISLYSSYSPKLRTWVIEPPAETYTGVLGLLQKNLPTLQPIEDSIHWQRSPTALILEMTALVVAALLPALWGWLQNQSWVWIYALIAFLLVNSLGVKLITIFDGRGQSGSTQSGEGKTGENL